LGSISQDPIGFAAGDVNQYRYVGNGPTNATDPSGLADDVPRWKRWWRSRYGAKRVPQKAADPAAAVNALSKYRSRRFFINGQNLLLDKSGMKHILERHHPSYWNGTVKSSQSFFPKNMSITDIEESIAEVLKQNPDKICEIGANGIGSMTGVVNGVRFQLGLNRGRIGQFFPILE
jgi:hypothetical protein